MGERLPPCPRVTEAPLPTVVVTVLNYDACQRGASEKRWIQFRSAEPHVRIGFSVCLMDRPLQGESPGRQGKPREELVGRDFLREDAKALGYPALGNAKSRMDHGRCINLHAHTIGISGVELPHIEHDLEGQEEAFHSPPQGVEQEHVLGTQAARIQDTGEGPVSLPLLPHLDHAQLLEGWASPDLHLIVLEDDPAYDLMGDLAYLAVLDRLVPTEEAIAAPILQVGEELGRTVQPVPQEQGSFNQGFRDQEASREFGHGGVFEEAKRACVAPEQVIEGGDAAGENSLPDLVKDLQTVGDLIEHGPVDDVHAGEPFLQVGQGVGKALGHHLIQFRRQPMVKAIEETRVEGRKAIEGGATGTLDLGQERVAADAGLFKDKAEGGGSFDYDGGPEPSQRIEAPDALPFLVTEVAEDLVTQGFGYKLVEKPDGRGQFNDAILLFWVVAASGHGVSSNQEDRQQHLGGHSLSDPNGDCLNYASAFLGMG